MDDIIQKSLIFPKINESKRYLQRLQQRKQLTREIVMQLQQNNSTSSYNLQSSKQQPPCCISLSKASYQFKKHHTNQKHYNFQQVQSQRQSTQRDSTQNNITKHIKTVSRVKTSRQDYRQQDSLNSNVSASIGQNLKPPIIETPLHYKNIKKRIDNVQQQIRQSHATSNRNKQSKLTQILKIQKLSSYDLKLAIKLNTPKKIQTKPFFLKNVTTNTSKNTKFMNTEIAAWNTQDYDRCLDFTNK